MWGLKKLLQFWNKNRDIAGFVYIEVYVDANMNSKMFLVIHTHCKGSDQWRKHLDNPRDWLKEVMYNL